MYTWQLNHILFPSTEALLGWWNEKERLGRKCEFMWRLKSRGRYLEGFRKVFKWPLRRNFSHKESSSDCRVEIECCYPQHRLITACPHTVPYNSGIVNPLDVIGTPQDQEDTYRKGGTQSSSVLSWNKTPRSQPGALTSDLLNRFHFIYMEHCFK